MGDVKKKGGARPGAGRKRVPIKIKQRRRVVAMLTDAEFSALKSAAGKEPLSAYVRRVLKRHLARHSKK